MLQVPLKHPIEISDPVNWRNRLRFNLLTPVVDQAGALRNHAGGRVVESDPGYPVRNPFYWHLTVSNGESAEPIPLV